MHESATVQVFLDHRGWHVPPTNTFTQQHMLGAQVRQAPGAVTEDRELLVLGQARAIRQHQLRELAPGARRIGFA